jgi:hypothetical protein
MPGHYKKNKKTSRVGMGKHKSKSAAATGILKRRAASRRPAPVTMVGGIPITPYLDPPQGFAMLYR